MTDMEPCEDCEWDDEVVRIDFGVNVASMPFDVFQELWSGLCQSMEMYGDPNGKVQQAMDWLNYTMQGVAVPQFTGTPYEPFDGDAGPEFGPMCCAQEMEWVDCAECGGAGIADYEDGGMELCEFCNGAGGDYVCANCGYTGLDARVQQELHQREE